MPTLNLKSTSQLTDKQIQKRGLAPTSPKEHMYFEFDFKFSSFTPATTCMWNSKKKKKKRARKLSQIRGGKTSLVKVSFSWLDLSKGYGSTITHNLSFVAVVCGVCLSPSPSSQISALETTQLTSDRGLEGPRLGLAIFRISTGMSSSKFCRHVHMDLFIYKTIDTHCR